MTVSATPFDSTSGGDHERSSPSNGNSRLNFWDRQYANGHDFGDQPSLTVRILAERLTLSNASVLDIGHGPNPRDTLELVRQGHRVFAIEESAVAAHKAADLYDEFREGAAPDVGRAEFLRADFKRASISPGHYDGANCHRVLHLVHPKNIAAFVNATARSLKPGAFIAIGARDLRDYNPEEMTQLPDGGIEIIKRPGHIINLWTPERFIRDFRVQFNILSFDLGEEMESNKMPDVTTRFVVMTAEKKKSPSDKLTMTEEAQTAAAAYQKEFGHVITMPNRSEPRIHMAIPLSRGSTFAGGHAYAALAR